MANAKNLFPLEAFFGLSDGDRNLEPNPAMLPAIQGAEVIFGVDVMSQREFLVYGRKALNKIVKSRKPRAMRVLRISIDQETKELEKLCALVKTVKGRFDYVSGN